MKPTVKRVKISEKEIIEISLPKASKLKGTFFVSRKILQNFEEHGHWPIKHIILTFEAARFIFR